MKGGKDSRGPGSQAAGTSSPLEMAGALQPNFPPVLALTIGVLAVSTGAIFARMADAPPLVIAAYRVGLAVLVLTPAAWIRSRHEMATMNGRDLCLAAASGFFLALHFAAWISSLSYTSVANSVVLVNTNPLWVALMTPFVTGERIRPAVALGIFVSVIGGVVISAQGIAGGGSALWGDLLAVAGSICAAVYLLLGRNLRRRLSLMAYIYLCYGSAAVFLWAAVLTAGLPVTGYSGSTVAAFWAMALITQLVGHTAYNWALRYFSAALIAVSLLGEPVGAAVMAYFLFSERLTWLNLAGAVLILVGIYIAAASEHRVLPSCRGENFRPAAS
jgi:drug/metabolite transporter (DMT)-like permease